MAVTANMGAAQPASRHQYGFLSLTVLLLLAAVVTAALTAYLLRLDQRSTPATTLPAPYRVLVLQGGQLWSLGTGDQLRSHALASMPGTVRAMVAAPDGSAMVAVCSVAGGDALYLVRGPGQVAQRLPLPPASYGAGPWRQLASAWLGNHDLAVLLADAGHSGSGILARYTVKGSAVSAGAWFRLTPKMGTLASLSPGAREVATLEVQAPAKGFDGQVQLRLREIEGTRTSVALRYLGAVLPEAILWSPDGGTLAIAVPGHGLAIQKSSGRAVRQAASGMLPAAFSPRGASIAYVSGTGRTRQIHVLNLHGEVDHVLTPPVAAPPTFLSWTPDARSLIYGAGGTVWQIDPTTAGATRLPGTISGTLVSVTPATPAFARW